MADRAPESEGHPVVAGLLALLGVGLAIGLLISGAALAGTSMLGLGESDDSGQASSDQTINVPKPEPTDPPTGPLITLEPKPSNEGNSAETEAPPEPEDAISLSAAVTEVRPGEPIDLSGVYPGGEGATLVVQRLEDGKWVDFAGGDVTASVTNETFSTYVITERTGLNTWRVRDNRTDEVSNEVRVQIG
ncbi:hypothetical protein [Nocardioides sp.]|uniref:hypothetical protein n=1 Tax=Nocardioides sp. TaxID=35761 RepID=UPI001A26FAB0|nr:hypothetical protein [Nocardioides sp.]MBJ7358718.1 hypothetical protein [Nocardioides sp.]